MDINYQNPTYFMGRGVLDYLDRQKETGFIKKDPADFIVRERVPGFPDRLLTTGPDSDFPCKFNNRPHNMVAATLVKWKLTTPDAQGRLAETLSSTLGRRIDPDSVQNSGLKDRWAVTAQTVVIPGVTVDEVRRCTWNNDPRGGFFLKDIRPADQGLEMGDHGTNHFNIVVRAPMSAADIEAYMLPKLEKLCRYGMWIPNAYGRQRLGRRQNLHVVGRTLVTGEFQAPPGVPEFGSAAEAAIYMFLFHSTNSEPAAARAIRDQASGWWLHRFDEMRDLFRKTYRGHNLSWELKLAERLADIERFGGSFEKVLASMKKDTSLFVGAWQSYWWNQVLARKLPAWQREMEESRVAQEAWEANGSGDDEYEEEEGLRRTPRHRERQPRRFNPAKKSIPMLMCTPEARTYYGRLNYCQEAMRDLNKADPMVRELFLTPRSRAGSTRSARGPWRKAFIKVDNLKYSFSEGAWNCEFDLRSGAYATTFLGQLWNLADPDEVLGAVPDSLE